MTTSPLDRARQIAADPRATTWVTQPGQGAELLHVIRQLVHEMELLAAGWDQTTDLLRETTRQLTAANNLIADTRPAGNAAVEACAAVLQLHQNSADNTCSSCRIPFPCDTRQAIQTRVLAA